MSLENDKNKKSDWEKYLINALFVLVIGIFPIIMLILGYLFWSNDNGIV